MKNFNDKNTISLKNGITYINNEEIELGIISKEWLSKYFEEDEYIIENYIKTYDELKCVKFINNNGLIIYLENDLITNINIYPFTYQSSPFFKGDIYIENKLLEVPFKSDDIEKYFSNAEVPKPPSKVMNRFLPREIVTCSINESLEVEISMSRTAELVGSISIKKVGV